jgi:effector-binding domain-containing protein
MGSNTKHVQIELDEEAYERFCKFAEEHGLSLEEAGREALLEWIERQQRADPNDRAFTQ